MISIESNQQNLHLLYFIIISYLGILYNTQTQMGMNTTLQ